MQKLSDPKIAGPSSTWCGRLQSQITNRLSTGSQFLRWIGKVTSPSGIMGWPFALPIFPPRQWEKWSNFGSTFVSRISSMRYRRWTNCTSHPVSISALHGWLKILQCRPSDCPKGDSFIWAVGESCTSRLFKKSSTNRIYFVGVIGGTWLSTV